MLCYILSDIKTTAPRFFSESRSFREPRLNRVAPSSLYHIVIGVEIKNGMIHRVKYWEIIADKLNKTGWSWGCVSAIDSCGRTRVLLKLASSPPSTSVPTPRIESDSIEAHENRTRTTALARTT